eukprot:15171674-Heterocapsa_arctica.AAC.1
MSFCCLLAPPPLFFVGSLPIELLIHPDYPINTLQSRITTKGNLPITTIAYTWLGSSGAMLLVPLTNRPLAT